MTATTTMPANISLPSISETIWDAKYRFKKPDGEPVDKTVEDTWRRIAQDLAKVEPKDVRSEMEGRFYDALDGYSYLPAGRITAGAGTDRNVTLFNCFVMGTIPDSMDGIFEHLKEAALTMQAGGGIGYDFSTLRPKGTLVKGVGADASGPLSFMDVWDAMCKTIMSAGSRRGAMMATMRCDHPDIEDFITAKQDPVRLRHFNVSVLVTDAFMKAVLDDQDWDLVWDGKVSKTVRAQDLWNLIMDSTYNQAEPGVIFIDRVNDRNPLKYCETIASSNPCGEQMLPPYGACLLGSINLATLIADPFGDNAALDFERMKSLVTTAVRMMDNVCDVSRFALEAQKDEALSKRRIGLGVTGLADALAMLKLTYGSERAAATVDTWMREISHAAYWASVELAKERGAFPLFDAEQYLASPTLQDMDQDLQDAIREHGIRNALLTSIAPTGTISIYAGNVSSGIEPIFAHSYIRKVLQKDGSHVDEEVVDHAVALYREKFGITSDKDLPEYFVTAQTLAPLEHVRMQAAAQKWVDNSISKTINCPKDITFDDFKNVYVEAWKQGCKGCTTYRPNEVTGSVLSTGNDKSGDRSDVHSDAPAEREEAMFGATYKLKWPLLPHAFYITINDRVTEDGRKVPHEIFINTKNVESKEWFDATTCLLTTVFRRTENPAFIIEELEGMFSPSGGCYMSGEYVPSLPSAIGGLLRQHVAGLGLMQAKLPKGAKVEAVVDGDVQQAESNSDLPANLGPACPSCGQFEMAMIEGCMTCRACGHSKCG